MFVPRCSAETGKIRVVQVHRKRWPQGEEGAVREREGGGRVRDRDREREEAIFIKPKIVPRSRFEVHSTIKQHLAQSAHPLFGQPAPPRYICGALTLRRPWVVLLFIGNPDTGGVGGAPMVFGCVDINMKPDKEAKKLKSGREG